MNADWSKNLKRQKKLNTPLQLHNRDVFKTKSFYVQIIKRNGKSSIIRDARARILCSDFIRVCKLPKFIIIIRNLFAQTWTTDTIWRHTVPPYRKRDWPRNRYRRPADDRPVRAGWRSRIPFRRVLNTNIQMHPTTANCNPWSPVPLTANVSLFFVWKAYCIPSFTSSIIYNNAFDNNMSTKT